MFWAVERYIEFFVFHASTVVTSTLRLLPLRITLIARSFLLPISTATDTAKNHLHHVILEPFLNRAFSYQRLFSSCFCSIASLLLAKPIIIEFSANWRLYFRPFLELDFLVTPSCFLTNFFSWLLTEYFFFSEFEGAFWFPPCLEQVVPNSRRCQVILSFFSGVFYHATCCCSLSLFVWTLIFIVRTVFVC